PQDLPLFQRLLGDGSDLGINLRFAPQPSPDGIAQAFIIGQEFIGDDAVCLILGDNIFSGQGFTEMRRAAAARAHDGTATIFGYCVNDPERYGVAKMDDGGRVVSIEEKPHVPESNYAVTGLYFYPRGVAEVAKSIKPSMRGELEITTVNQHYLGRGNLHMEILGRGFAWLDTGTHDSLSEASAFIETIEKRQGLKVACLEEIAFRQEWITRERLRELAEPMRNNPYGKYMRKL
ncbi:MAG: glucose-1-phosphate thymidylyltransferase, partial [Alistipes sp.]|nr:glucose-1-phosphate thymidylyltransferase [Alistipes sp.]